MERSRSTLLTRAVRALRSPGALALLVTVCLLLAAAAPTWANVYASSLVKTSANSLSYILNENADSGVTFQVCKANGEVVYSENHAKGETPTDYAAKGKHTWTWNGSGAEPGGTYTIKIAASDNGYTAWSMISVNSTFNNFLQPRGVAVNTNPGSQYFGRIYVAENGGKTTSGRTTTDGIYMVNADLTDAVGQGDTARTGGITWTTASTNTPYHVEVGPDDNVYVSGYGDAQSGIWEASPDFNNAVPVLDNSGTPGTGNGVHGSITGFVVKGLGADRQIWTLDEDLSPVYSCWRYDIGTKQTFTTAPTLFYDTPFVTSTEDICAGKDGTFWMTQSRAGLAGRAETSLCLVDATGKLVWRSVPDSWVDTLADPLRYAISVAYDPNHDYVAIGSHDGGNIKIFDYNTKTVLATFCSASTSAYNYQVEFDAVGNLCVVDNYAQRLFIFSPPDRANSHATASYFTFDGFGTERNLTINVTPAGSGTVTGAGVVYTGQHKTVTALEVPGYKFQQWTDAQGNQLSTSESYTFNMPDSDLTINAVFQPSTQRRLSLAGNPTEAIAALTGAGMYEPGSSVPVAATAKALWTFSKWTTDPEGNNVVSTDASFNYTMPSSPTTLYAQYEVQKFNINVLAAPSAGGSPSVEGGTRQTYNTNATVHAAPASDGYCFLYWTKNADGTSIVSRQSDYTFKVPGNDVTLYANYAKALFAENFEGLALDALDMNYGSGKNFMAGGIGNGNPWWGTQSPNAAVGTESTLAVHKGTNAAWGGFRTNGREYANLSYRCNNGSSFSEKAVYCDWWFYDRLGATWNPTAGNYCDDALSLVYAGAFPNDTDVPSDTSGNYVDTVFAQKISLGMATDWCDSTGVAYTGFDPTKYQARIKVGEVTGQTPFANGWYNLSVARSAGWHHARIVMGDIDWGNYVNPVSFYIDDMSTPALSGTMSPEIKGIEFTTGTKPTGVTGTPKSALYDDITFGYPVDAPAAPTAAAATGVWATGITWNWTANGAADAYRVYDAATGGNQKGRDLSSTTTSYAETGLTGNTLYSRWVAAVNGLAFESARTALAPTYSLASAPIVGTNVATTAAANGFYSTATWPGFTNPQGFGIGGKVSAFKYKWSTSSTDTIADGAGTDWSTGTLTTTPGAEGAYYLYLKSYNAAGVSNPTAGKLGPYVFDNTPPTGSVLINNDDAKTTAIAVTLTVTANDANIDKMSISNDNSTWSTPEAITTTKAWTLSTGGGTKTVYVKFTDKAGNSVVVSDTILYEDAKLVDKISDLWAKANDTQAYKLVGKAVSGAVSGAFWIEEANRSAAIKVVWSGAVTQDYAADVTGTLSVVGGQRILTASSVTLGQNPLADADKIKPITVVERAAGGKAINADTPSITSGTGLYNIGMLVRIAGNVTASGTGFFYLDDGSGLMDGENMGIKVICGSVTAPTEGTKTVTGLVGVENGKAVLIIRAAGDIQ